MNESIKKILDQEIAAEVEWQRYITLMHLDFMGPKQKILMSEAGIEANKIELARLKEKFKDDPRNAIFAQSADRPDRRGNYWSGKTVETGNGNPA